MPMGVAPVPSLLFVEHAVHKEAVAHVVGMAGLLSAYLYLPAWLLVVDTLGNLSQRSLTTILGLFAFAATTGAVRDRHFEMLFDAYIRDETVRAFMARSNPAALRETAARFLEALERGLWRPRANFGYDLLRSLADGERP